MKTWVLLGALLFGACGSESPDVDASVGSPDASVDARDEDVARDDAGPDSSAPVDGGVVDAAGDVGTGDASTGDASTRDGSVPEVPNRLVIIHVPHGVGDAWRSTGEGSDFELSELLAPLRAVQDKTIIIDGLDLVHPEDGNSFGATHRWGPGLLYTGRLGSPTEFTISGAQYGGGPSLDQIIAAGSTTALQSIELGVFTRDARFGHEISYAARDEALPRENDPRTTLARLFGDSPPTTPEAIESVDRISTGLASLPSGLRPADAALITQLQLELIRAAFMEDRTRVASIRFSQNLQFPWLGINTRWNQLAHMSSTSEEARRELETVWGWVVEQVADFATSLDAVAVGEGTLLDHTLIVFASETGDPRSHSGENIPVVLIGNAGGAFVTGQRVVVDRTHMSLPVILAEAFGVTDAFDGLAEGSDPTIDVIVR